MTCIRISAYPLYLLVRACTLDTTIMQYPAELDSLRTCTHTYCKDFSWPVRLINLLHQTWQAKLMPALVLGYCTKYSFARDLAVLYSAFN